jgi:hypothetical protein
MWARSYRAGFGQGWPIPVWLLWRSNSDKQTFIPGNCRRQQVTEAVWKRRTLTAKSNFDIRPDVSHRARHRAVSAYRASTNPRAARRLHGYMSIGAATAGKLGRVRRIMRERCARLLARRDLLEPQRQRRAFIAQAARPCAPSPCPGDQGRLDAEIGRASCHVTRPLASPPASAAACGRSVDLSPADRSAAA